jgi:ectoine hydroxylase-related dioxygenase (phytanoyl-CoA dioxygenase family)
MSFPDLERRLADFDRDGYVILERWIEPALVGEIREALDRAERDHALGFGETTFEGRQTVRIYNLLAYDETFWKIPIHERVLPFAEAVLDEGLQLSSLSAITLCPGQGGQPIHADDQVIPVAKPHQPFTLNCFWAISDFTEANGATRVVPGSHKADGPPEYGRDYPSIPAEMPAGSVLFFHGSLWHGGGSNRTSERRYAVSNYYCAGYIRAQENQQLGIPMETARRFPRRLQELCGYSVYRGLYGHVANHDPIEMLGRESDTRLVWQQFDDAIEAGADPFAKDGAPE